MKSYFLSSANRIVANRSWNLAQPKCPRCAAQAVDGKTKLRAVLVLLGGLLVSSRLCHEILVRPRKELVGVVEVRLQDCTLALVEVVVHRRKVEKRPTRRLVKPEAGVTIGNKGNTVGKKRRNVVEKQRGSCIRVSFSCIATGVIFFVRARAKERRHPHHTHLVQFRLCHSQRRIPRFDDNDNDSGLAPWPQLERKWLRMENRIGIPPSGSKEHVPQAGGACMFSSHFSPLIWDPHPSVEVQPHRQGVNRPVVRSSDIKG